MSFPESDLSDILEKTDVEELYRNVGDIVYYVDSNSCGETFHDNLSNTFKLDAEETIDFKRELVINDCMTFPLNNTSHSLQHQQMPEPMPPPVLNQPSTICNDDYAGPYNFEVSIIPNGTKNPWVYSNMLNKVFIDMGAQFPVDFRVSSRPQEDLYVRVMPSFSSLQHAQDLVYRCVQHEQEHLNRDIANHIRQHIIRCTNANAHYLGDKNFNQRLSIIFPLSYPHAGADAVREMFVFVCKNSCPSGMNRKPIEIIFTLEKIDGEILGRRILNVRICSCPKRDKEKEEKDALNKGAAPHGKKRKIGGGKVEKPVKTEKTDVKDRNIVPIMIEVAGKHRAQQVMQYCQDLMAADIMKNPQNTEAIACYKKLQAQLSQF